MAISISAVEASQPERLVSAADEVGTQAMRLDTLIQSQRDSINHLRDEWSGPAADAAIARGEQNLTGQESLRDGLQTVQNVLAFGGGQLNSTRTVLLDIVGQLRGQGWQIADDGVATPPPNLHHVFHSYPEAYTQLLQRLLQTYDGIDGETAARFPTFG